MRLEKGIGLRRLADTIGVTPAYLSEVERDAGSPPTEKTITAIARALGRHPDELLALAGRVAPDLAEIIHRYPRELGTFLRVVGKLSAGEIEELTKFVERRKRPGI